MKRRSTRSVAIKEPTKRVARTDYPTWRQFQKKLEGVLARLAVEHYLIIGTRGSGDESVYYVQFAQGGQSGFLAEAVSNRFLMGNRSLSPKQEQRMTELGWMWPTPGSKQPRNFDRQWPMSPPPFRDAAHLAVHTLREVYGVKNTSELTYKAFAKAGRAYALPALAIDAEPLRPTKQAPSTATMAELKPLVEDAIRHVLEVETIKYDKQGDIPVRMGSAMVFVRMFDGSPPMVRVFSPVVWGIPESPEVLVAVNDANLRIRFGRLMWTGKEVMAAMEVSAVGIHVDDVAFACLQIGGIADHFDDEFQKQFGGNTMFGPREPPKHPARPPRGIIGFK